MKHSTNAKELRSFGLLTGGVFALIGVWPIIFRGESLRIWAAVVGVVLMVCGGLSSTFLAPFYKGWMRLGHVLGWINTRILLAVVFFGLVTPIGLLYRLMGKDTMRRAFSESSSTYRVNRQPRSLMHMKNQF